VQGDGSVAVLCGFFVMMMMVVGLGVLYFAFLQEGREMDVS